MKGLVLTAAAFLALTVPAAAGAAGHPVWVTYPTCTATPNATATTSDLTCTGRAAGVQPQSLPDLGPVQAAIYGHVHWLCLDADGNPLDDFIGTANFRLGDLLPFAVDFHNGQVFTIPFTPSSYDFGSFFVTSCPGGIIQDPSDLSYYDVRVAIGWGFGAPSGPQIALEAPIGTVSP
jgi:hypothetical protein